MLAVVKRADGKTDIFEAENYSLCKVKDLHPLINSVRIYKDGKCIAKLKRPFAWLYSIFKFNTVEVQNKLKELEEQASREEA